MTRPSSRDGASRQGLSIQFLSRQDHAYFTAHELAQIASNQLPLITLQFLARNKRNKGALREEFCGCANYETWRDRWMQNLWPRYEKPAT